jgi:hypothetical protein
VIFKIIIILKFINNNFKIYVNFKKIKNIKKKRKEKIITLLEIVAFGEDISVQDHIFLLKPN